MMQPKLSSRFTEDFHFVPEYGEAWEIMYKYLNPEISEAYPEERKVSEIPMGAPIWLHKENCERECRKINLKPRQYKHPYYEKCIQGVDERQTAKAKGITPTGTLPGS